MPSSLDTLLNALLKERGQNAPLPATIAEKRYLLRALMNTRPPGDLSPDLLRLQDEELQRQREEKGVVNLEDLPDYPRLPGIKLWQGDITRLKVDAIVNAGNSALLGCFIPCHNCIDNAIHSAAGMQLRKACAELMQGRQEGIGEAVITPAFNMPARHVIHTVGPAIASGLPDEKEKQQLASCYDSVLGLAKQAGLHSVAFCCISTGVFRFPPVLAAQIAISTTLAQRGGLTIVFNVFTDRDLQIYQKELDNV